MLYNFKISITYFRLVFQSWLITLDSPRASSSLGWVDEAPVNAGVVVPGGPRGGKEIEPQLVLHLRSAFIEGLPVDLVQLLIRQVSIQAGGADVAVPGQRLSHLEVARGAQDDGHEVVPERVGGDGAESFDAQRLLHPTFDDVAPGLCGHRPVLVVALFRPRIVAHEKRQGPQRLAGRAIQGSPRREVIPQRIQAAGREADHGLLVTFADQDGFAFVPIQVAAAHLAGFVHPQTGIGQRQQESPVAQVAQAFVLVFNRLAGQPLGIVQQLLDGLPGELGQALAWAADAPFRSCLRRGRLGSARPLLSRYS